MAQTCAGCAELAARVRELTDHLDEVQKSTKAVAETAAAIQDQMSKLSADIHRLSFVSEKAPPSESCQHDWTLYDWDEALGAYRPGEQGGRWFCTKCRILAFHAYVVQHWPAPGERRK